MTTQCVPTNADDATAALQGAIDSGVTKVIVPYRGRPWAIRPITLASDQEIIFEPGVKVIAEQGEFKGMNDCLFEASDKEHIILRGYGATLGMRKEDYIGSGYDQGEWRHILQLVGCHNVEVLGLTLRDSGGDGIYLGQGGATSPHCKDIFIEDCTCDNNYRQGISVVSAEDLRIVNCTLKNTSGHSPGAGIDLEPNEPWNKLANIVVRNCISEDNEGRGFIVSLHKLNEVSADISIVFKDCYAKGCGRGLEIVTNNLVGPKGSIEFRNCVVEDALSAAAWIVTNTRSFGLRFTKCKINNTNCADAFPEKEYIFSDNEYGFPIVLRIRRQETLDAAGEIYFDDCWVYGIKDGPALFVRTSGSGVINIGGNIYAQRKDIGEPVTGPDAENIRLNVEWRVDH